MTTVGATVDSSSDLTTDSRRDSIGHGADPLRGAFGRGVAWSGAARWTAQAVTWMSTLAVARLLTPDDYGLIAMATVTHGLVTVLSEFGVGMTVVTLRGLSPAQLAQFNALATLLGVAGFATLAALAPAIAIFFSRPGVVPVVVALAATFLVSGIRTVPSALLQRELRFGVLGATEALQAIAGAVTTCSLAWKGWGYWSIVAGTLVSTSVWTAAVLTLRRVRFAWPRRAALGPALTFTRHQLTGSLAWYCYSNADFVVAGRVLGAHQLGLYTMAWTLARVVPERIANVVIRVTPAFFAAIADRPRVLIEWLYRVTEGLAIVCFPLLVGLAMVAADALTVLTGSQWGDAVVPLRFLAIYSAFDVVTQPVTRALVAAGDVRFTSRLGLTLAIVMPLVFAFGARGGPTGLAVAWIVAAPAVRILALSRSRMIIGLEPGDYWRSLWPAISATAVMALLVSGVLLAMREAEAVARLTMAITTGGAVYVTALRTLHPRTLSAWLRYWRSVRAA